MSGGAPHGAKFADGRHLADVDVVEFADKLIGGQIATRRVIPEDEGLALLVRKAGMRRERGHFGDAVLEGFLPSALVDALVLLARAAGFLPDAREAGVEVINHRRHGFLFRFPTVREERLGELGFHLIETAPEVDHFLRGLLDALTENIEALVSLFAVGAEGFDRFRELG